MTVLKSMMQGSVTPASWISVLSLLSGQTTLVPVSRTVSSMELVVSRNLYAEYSAI